MSHQIESPGSLAGDTGAGAGSGVTAEKRHQRYSFSGSRSQGATRHRQVDFEAVAKAALAACPGLLMGWFPAGRLVGQEFEIGDLAGNPGHSLKINAATGKWKDFASDESGNDIVALCAAKNKIRQYEAAIELAHQLGLTLALTPKRHPPGQRVGWSPVMPVPDGAPDPAPHDFKLGVPNDQYRYLDADGKLLAVVCRWNLPPKMVGGKPDKRVKPYMWATAEGGRAEWRFIHPTGPKPLYHLERLAREPDHTVLIVEGEGKADAAQRIFDRDAVLIVATSWMGGSGNVSRADISPLAGRRLVVWPDNDAPGLKAADQMARRLADLGCAALTVVDLAKLPEPKPAAWDLGDAERENWSADQVLEMVQQSRPWEPSTGEGSGPAPLSSGAVASRDSRPVIRIVAGDLPRMVDEAEAALIAASTEIYQRGTCLCRAAMVPARISGGRTVEVPRLVEISRPYLLDQLASVAAWVKWDGRTKALAAKDVPPAVAEMLLARIGEWKFPVLTGQVSAPTLRPDGSILDRPGYDPGTGLLFEPRGAEFPPVPAEPTRDDARRALDLLVDLVSTFPFEGPADRSVALSAILTATVRRSLATAPLHGFSAKAAGSGKTMLVDIASIIATGSEAPVQSPGRNSEEFEKRLGSSLIAGDAVVAIDNVEGPLGGELLCQVLTQPLVRIRQLGQSINHEIAVNSFVCATGNALVVVGDLSRRALLSSLDAKVERPELREFDRDPIEHAKAHRAELAVAALVVARAYHVAGRPERPRPLGSFRDWSAWVRGALIWLGEADPVATMELVRAADPKLTALRTVVEQWRGVIGQDRVTVSQIIERACRQTAGGFGAKPEFLHPEFREALLAVAGAGGAISSRRLGIYLGRSAGRIVGTTKIVADGLADGVQLWQLITEHESGSSGSWGALFSSNAENCREEDTLDIHACTHDANLRIAAGNCPPRSTTSTSSAHCTDNPGGDPPEAGSAFKEAL